MLEPPIPLPDFDNPGKELRSPQNPFNEEISAVRIMNAVRTHARLHKNNRAPVFSPWDVLLEDNNPNTFIDTRANLPASSGLVPASSEVFNVALLKAASYPVVPYTINDKSRMLELMRLGVNSIISDRPDVLRQAIEEFDANGDGTRGDFLVTNGLSDASVFDVQGHRGAHDLRPENTLSALEAALNLLVSPLETDTGITADGVPVLNHDLYVKAQKCRRSDGAPYRKRLKCW